MRLTKRQRALFEEAEAIAKLISLDFHNIEDRDIDPALALQIAIHKMVTGELVIRYTLLDEILADLIANIFLKALISRGYGAPKNSVPLCTTCSTKSIFSRRWT